MSIPGNAELGAYSGQQQVQQQLSINISSAIPIKKRKFPIIRPPSPSPEENPSSSEADISKNKQESGVQAEGLYLSHARNTASPANSDASRTSASIVKNEEVTPTNIELGQANGGILATKHQEAIPSVGLGPIDDLSDKNDVLSKGKSLESAVLESCIGARTTNVKQEIVSGQTEDTRELNLSTGLMNVELSLGPKEPLASTLELQNVEAICHKSDKSDPSMLSLALSEEKLVLHDNHDNTMHNVSSRVCANRSNWDLNTTMDAWEGSTSGDAFAHRCVDVGGLGNISNCHHEKSSLTTSGMVGLTLNKGKHTLDDHRRSSYSMASIQSTHQCKTDVSLGLRLAIPYSGLDVTRQCSSLSDNLVSTNGPNLIMQQVQPSTMNVNRTVKSEPVDENSKHDHSIGSCSSSNMGSSNFSSVKREFVNNHNVETVLQSSISTEKSVEQRSIMSEMVQEDNKECKSEDAIGLPSVSRVMQHQESCASSSAQSVASMPQNSFPSRLSTHSELTTSGDLPNESEHSILSKKLRDHSDVSNEKLASMASNRVSQDDTQLRLCKVGNSNLVDADKCKLPRVDEDTLESCQEDDVIAAMGEENTNISAKMHEKNSFRSDCESQENCAIDSSMDIGEKRCDKEDEEYEDGEVREPLPHSAGEETIIEGNKTENSELVECESRNLQPFVLLADQNINALDIDGKTAVNENHDETHSNENKDYVNSSFEPNSEDNSLQKLTDMVLDVGIDEKRSTSDAPDKQLDLSGRQDIGESPGKEVSSDAPANESHGMGVELGNEATDNIFKETRSGENDSTLSKVEVSLNGHDAAKESNNAGNKSRIINLSRTAVVTSPSKTRYIPDRLLTSRSGKERYPDLDGEMQPRGNRDEIYTGGSHKFGKDRVHDQSFRNSRPSFMLGKGRISGRFGSIRSEWDSDHGFASETYGPSDYRAIRRKHAPSISDVDLECNGYGVPLNDAALGSNRRKSINDEFPSLRRTSLRRFSPGDRDAPVTRGMQMLRRIPRNMSPSRGTVEDGSDVIGLRHSEKFMRHLSDDIIDPVYGRQQAMYDEIDGQLMRGNRNFSTLNRKGYPQIHSKSPVSSRTRSPGPWSSPRRRSPNGLPDLTQQRSPTHYRMGRMRSPDRPCFRDEIVARRRGSPSYISRHPNDLRDMDSGREHGHPRSANSNRRSSPARVFPRSARRADALDSREMGDDDEYNNGLIHSNKFHELRGDGSIDERRKFIERRGAPRSFRPSYNNDSDNFRFHLNDGPRPYRFCPEADSEFVERNIMREREFDGRIKPFVPRRIRNMEEQQDGNYRPVERVWHDDGFSDARGKRRRF